MINEIHQKILNQEIKAVELVEKYFKKIEKEDKNIQAYLTLTQDLALEQAQAIDNKVKRGEAIGKLAGIPLAIKDNILIQGIRATSASKILDNYIAPYDATVIRKLKKEGAVFLGKTNMDEFAMGASTETSAYQKTKNPRDLSRVPGGSSGGSAAVVASDQAVWALGSDTGGSIRQPASFCGVVGLKPTYGRVSRYGLMAMASSFDQIGPLTHSVEDAAITLSVLAGEDKKDATSAKSSDKLYENYLTGDIQGKKIGIVQEHYEGLDKEMKDIFFQAIDKFKKLGAIIEEIEMPHNQYALATYYILITSEVSSNMARYDGIKYGLSIDDEENSGAGLLETYLDTRQYGLGAEVKRRIMLGTYALSAGYYDAYYKKAQKVRNLIKQDYKKAFQKVDFIFSPVAPEVAFKFGEKMNDPLKMYLSDIYTITANLAGVPAISFPIGNLTIDEKKLPVGGQLSAQWFDEEGLLNTAYTWEEN